MIGGHSGLDVDLAVNAATTRYPGWSYEARARRRTAALETRACGSAILVRLRLGSMPHRRLMRVAAIAAGCPEVVVAKSGGLIFVFVGFGGLWTHKHPGVADKLPRLLVRC